LSQSNRSQALDALRGIAILLMVFSSRIPFGVLPDWIYHAQMPPPLHKFNPAIPGITWVDLVFPFFLFTMGAAIPLAIAARLAKGDSIASIVVWIFKRGLVLAFFAIYVKHIQPGVMATTAGPREWGLAILGFLLLFPMLASLPTSLSTRAVLGIRALGWAGAIAVLYHFRAADGSGFSVMRSDIIIVVLANVAVSGGLIWLVTRDHIDWRLGILGFLLALRLTQSLPGWGEWFWNLSPIPWMVKTYFHQYLFIIIPGTIVGDLLLRYRNAPHTNVTPDARHIFIAALGVVMTLLLLVGLKTRAVGPTTITATLLCLILWQAAKSLPDAAGALLRGLIGWGIFWLLLGLAFEPYEGGIKKDRATVSYYFVTSGLAAMVLASLFVVIDMARIKRGFGLLIATGQNPLVAYAGVQSFVAPLLSLTGIAAWLAKFTPTPWLGVLRGAFVTWLTALPGAWAAKRNLLLKT
jgi:predicted acyltransferase